jgi:hypothetical protein
MRLQIAFLFPKLSPKEKDAADGREAERDAERAEKISDDCRK